MPTPPPRPRLEQSDRPPIDPLVLEAFQRFDVDGSGGISREEMAAMVAELQLPVTAGYMTMAWDSYDVNGSGVLELSEFALMMNEGIYRNALAAVKSSRASWDVEQPLAGQPPGRWGSQPAVRSTWYPRRAKRDP